MRIAVFNTKPYDKEYFEKYLKTYNYSFSYFENALNKETTSLSAGFDVVCVFVNDKLDKDTIKILSDNGVGLIA